MFHDKVRSVLLLSGVFAANFLETWSETRIEEKFLRDSDIGARFASAFQAFEGWTTTFEFSNTFQFDTFASRVILYSSSAAYFFLFPMLAVCVAIALARRTNPIYLRCFAYAIALNYLISLPFYLVYPIPERWAFPESNAILLSDHISSRLIEAFRPISALDNCFPSSHVSVTVLLILAAYTFQMQLKHFVLAIGLAVILSTYILGIHWLPDIIAGVAAGIVSWFVVIAIHLKHSGTVTNKKFVAASANVV